MLNKFKITSLAGIAAVATLLGSGQAFAFDGTPGNINNVVDTSTDCRISFFYSPGFNYIPIQASFGYAVIYTPDNTHVAGGDYWAEDSTGTGVSVVSASSESTNTSTVVFPAITPTDLYSHCNITNIQNLQQTGASGKGTLADPNGAILAASYYGLSFRATSNADGLLYDYEYAFSGATNTQMIVRQSLANVTPPSGNTIVADTQKKISDFTVERLNRLATSQPGLLRFLRKDVNNSFNANSRLNFASINGSVSSGNAWAKLTGTKSNSGSYVLGSLGAHTFVSDNFLLGGMLQLDYAEDDANKISGKGWLVGPYFVAKHSTQPLFFEGRLLYGQTDNKITPLGTFTDNFKTARWLAQFRTTGEVSYNAVTLMPLLDLTYADDTQKTYTDSLGNIISGKTVELMQLTAGMDFRVPVSVQTGSLDLTGGVSGIYSSTSDGNADYEGLRGRADLGIEYSLGEAGTLDVNTFVDGLGSDYQGHGMDIGYNLKF